MKSFLIAISTAYAVDIQAEVECGPSHSQGSILGCHQKIGCCNHYEPEYLLPRRLPAIPQPAVNTYNSLGNCDTCCQSGYNSGCGQRYNNYLLGGRGCGGSYGNSCGIYGGNSCGLYGRNYGGSYGGYGCY